MGVMHMEGKARGNGDMWYRIPESLTIEVPPASHLLVFSNVEAL